MHCFLGYVSLHILVCLCICFFALFYVDKFCLLVITATWKLIAVCILIYTGDCWNYVCCVTTTKCKGKKKN